nr:hypothetical protein [Candidatus Sigynarchaeum springense]
MQEAGVVVVFDPRLQIGSVGEDLLGRGEPLADVGAFEDAGVVGEAGGEVVDAVDVLIVVVFRIDAGDDERAVEEGLAADEDAGAAGLLVVDHVEEPVDVNAEGVVFRGGRRGCIGGAELARAGQVGEGRGELLVAAAGDAAGLASGAARAGDGDEAGAATGAGIEAFLHGGGDGVPRGLRQVGPGVLPGSAGMSGVYHGRRRWWSSPLFSLSRTKRGHINVPRARGGARWAAGSRISIPMTRVEKFRSIGGIFRCQPFQDGRSKIYGR